jgi:hypothetical protein
VSDTAFSPAVSVYSSLLAALKFADASGLSDVRDALVPAMDAAWGHMTETERNRWFQGER